MEPTWRIKKYLTFTNKAIKGAQANIATGKKGLSRMLLEGMERDKCLIRAELARRK